MDLARDYGLTTSALQPHPGGFRTDAWVVDRRWFVKLWPAGEKPTGLETLSELAALGLPVIEPVRTVRGELSAMADDRAYAVFPYVEGRTATWDDWRVAARALRQVRDVPPRVDLPAGNLDEPHIWELGRNLDHPWIVDRRDEVAAAIERVRDVIAGLKPVREVVCHTDFHGLNLLLDDEGEVLAILDREDAVIGPREHDVWVAAEGPQVVEFLEEYGVRDLDLGHLEYALLARGLRDMSARVLQEVDRPGVDTWGFDRIRRVDRMLEVFRAYCG
ncbi:aminoglycoside phosphotransferase family protein [Kribbella sp. NPDC026611]|uniref:phosphotransferase enzyme family protein n=1 Tax=Kribbella sp. NPDC026611 TaxID=3154911 RepID=UPI003401DAD0